MLHRGQIQSGAIVLDVGCAVTRCGFAGEELPSCLIPTMCSSSSSTSRPIAAAASSPRKDATYTSPLYTDENGLVQDWEGVKSLVEYCVFERLGVGSNKDFGGSAKKRRGEVSSENESMEGIASTLDRSSDRGRGDRDLEEHPVLLAEPLFASKDDKKRWCEMLIDTLKAPGVFMTRAGVLSIYANARVTGMSVDIGAGGISVLPVQEGFALLAGSIRSPIGGNFLDSEYLQEANSQLNSSLGNQSSEKRRIRPRVPGASLKKIGEESLSSSSALNFEDFTASVQDYYSLCLARDLKEHVCRVLSEAPKSEPAPLVPTIEYELPDGQILRMGQHRFSIPELMFNPDPVVMKFPGVMGLHDAISKSTLACEADIRRDLLSNIILTGGSSVIPGLQDRLLTELGESTLPVGCKARISAASEAERAHGSWLGGSILASLGTFPDLWLSRDEYKSDPRMLYRKLV